MKTSNKLLLGFVIFIVLCLTVLNIAITKKINSLEKTTQQVEVKGLTF
jgi:CHASE3 domain sensor protein